MSEEMEQRRREEREEEERFREEAEFERRRGIQLEREREEEEEQRRAQQRGRAQQRATVTATTDAAARETLEREEREARERERVEEEMEDDLTFITSAFRTRRAEDEEAKTNPSIIAYRRTEADFEIQHEECFVCVEKHYVFGKCRFCRKEVCQACILKDINQCARRNRLARQAGIDIQFPIKCFFCKHEGWNRQQLWGI